MEETEIVLGEALDRPSQKLRAKGDAPYELFIAMIKGTRIYENAMFCMENPDGRDSHSIQALADAWEHFKLGWKP